MALLTRKQAAELLGVKARTITDWQRKGKLKASLYVSGRPRFDEESLEGIVTKDKESYIPPAKKQKS